MSNNEELKPIWAAIEVFGRHFDGLAKQIAEDETSQIFADNYYFDREATHPAVLVAEDAVRALGAARLAFSKEQMEDLKVAMNALYAMETEALGHE